MRAQIDILLYLDSFRNIDVFLQGLYYLQIKLSEDAVPFYFDSSSVSKRFHNLYPPQILDNNYASKIFMLKYAEEVVKICETVIFRAEFDPNSYEDQFFTLQVDLMFTDLKGDLSPNSVQNYFTAPPQESLFTKVGESRFTINSSMQAVNQMIFVTYLDTFSSSLMATVHAMPVNYKIPENFIEDLFPDSPDIILKEKIDRIYDVYVVPLGLGYNKLVALLETNTYTSISLPLLIPAKIEPDYIYKVVYRSLFSACIETQDKGEVASAVVQEIQELAAMIVAIKHELLQVLKINPVGIMNKLLTEYVTLMDDRWGENIIQEVIQGKITIISSKKDQQENIETAKILKSGANFHSLRYFTVVDDRLFSTPEANTILFETAFCTQNLSAGPPISGVLKKNSKTRHLIILVHGYLGTYIDVKMLQDTISNVYAKGLFLLSRANEGQTNTSIGEMGVRLANEVKGFLQNSSSIFIDKISFVGHSLGGLIIRASLPYLSELQDRFYSYISLACPHLGCLNNESKLIDAGMWILCKIKQSLLLNQLVLKESKDMRHSLLYTLSKEQGLGWFKKVYFFSSSQDSYVPFHSARVEVGSSIYEGDTLEYEMANNIVSQITGSMHRINTIFYINSLEVANIIGRSAHIMFLDNLQFLNILVFKYIL